MQSSREATKEDSRVLRNLTMGKTAFRDGRIRLLMQPNHWQKPHLFIPKHTTATSSEMNTQLRCFQKVFDIVDQRSRNVCVTLQGYNVDKSESFYNGLRVYAKKNEAVFSKVSMLKKT